MKLEQKLAEALANLRGNRDFTTVLEGMRAHEAEELQRCVELDGASLSRAQGAVKVLQAWQKMFAEAPAALEKFKHSPPTK